MLPKVEYAVIIIVGVVHRSTWRWYVSDTDYWFLDRVTYRDSFRRHGHLGSDAQKLPDLPAIAVVNEDTADRFLAQMESHRVDTPALRRLVIERLPISSWDDIIDLCPSLLVDFDGKRLLSLYPEPASFEAYVPTGWSGTYEDFLAEVPEEERYWIVNGHDYFAPFLRV